ncbi:MAG TPA: alpha-L-fucosidase [Patescibacteria group bacterium]|nr:alpha-L-fucosidase [Patescibacteria group bacterium]
MAGRALLGLGWSAVAIPHNPDADWFKDAKYGVFMHFLPPDAKGLALSEKFDVEALADQLHQAGAKYLVFTLGQNSGYFNAPNATYDRFTGYSPGEHCARRDLPLALSGALHSRGIKLMLYLPCQVPNEDARAQKAFRLPEGKGDQPLSLEFAQKWAEVIQEWSDRYRDKVAGWWFDGGYEHIHFSEAMAQIYAQAAKHGNPHAIVTFNPGVRVIHYTQAEDYTAGELNEPFDQVPSSRWLAGSQWHALTFLGSNWGQRNTRYSGEQWARWVRTVAAAGGVVTLDMGPNYDPLAGPVGSLAAEQVKQLHSIKLALEQTGASVCPSDLNALATAPKWTALEHPDQQVSQLHLPVRIRFHLLASSVALRKPTPTLDPDLRFPSDGGFSIFTLTGIVPVFGSISKIAVTLPQIAVDPRGVDGERGPLLSF